MSLRCYLCGDIPKCYWDLEQEYAETALRTVVGSGRNCDT